MYKDCHEPLKLVNFLRILEYLVIFANHGIKHKPKVGKFVYIFDKVKT